MDAVYDLIQTTDADQISEVMKPQNLYGILKAFQQEDGQTRRMVAETLGKLVRAAVDTGRELREEEK